MRRPYYLGVRSPRLFESALRDVDRYVLRSLLDEAATAKPGALDPPKIRLVKAELTRRQAGDVVGFVVVVVSLLGFLSSQV